jgi:hypothetical protein
MSDNPLLRDLTPHLARRGFRPEVGGRITVTLPGESVSAVVIKTISVDALIVQLGLTYFGKNHQYRKDDIVPVRRGVDSMLQTEFWEVVSTRAAALASAVAEFERSEVARVAKAMTQFDQAEAVLSGSVDSAAPETSPMPQRGQADIGQARAATALAPPMHTAATAAVGLPQADTDQRQPGHRLSDDSDAVETRIVKGKDGTLKRESKPRRGRGKPPQPHQA